MALNKNANPVITSLFTQFAALGWTEGYEAPNVAMELVRQVVEITKAKDPAKAAVLNQAVLEYREVFEKLAIKRATKPVSKSKFKSMNCDSEIAKLLKTDQYTLGMFDAIVSAFNIRVVYL